MEEGTLPRRSLSSRDYFLTLTAAAALTLAFPRFDVQPLALVALVPLLLALEGLSLWQAGGVGYLFGVHWTAFLLYWLSPATTPGFLAVVAYQGLFPALFAFLYAAAKRYGRVPSVVAFPILWVGVEYVRTLGYLAFPWALLAHTQYKFELLIQIAAWAGVWPVSLTVAAVNALAYAVYRDYRTPATWLRAGGTAAILVGGLCLFGALARTDPQQGTPLKVAAIQPNVDQDEKWDLAYRDTNFRTLVDKTYAARRDGAALIIWPETATPFYLLEDGYYRELVYDVAADTGADILTGSVERKKRAKVIRGRDYDRYNAAFLLSPDRRLLARYAKVRLVPFGEHIPWEQDIPAVTENLFAESGDFTPGPRYNVMKGRGYTLGCSICYEIVFSDIQRTLTARGAEFLVNLTNEAWFGKTNAPYQTLAAATYRAVENRRWLVRSANTGVTCFINPNGRIVRKSKIYIRNQLTDTVYRRRDMTFYARHGDWFGLAVAGAGALLSLYSLVTGVRVFLMSRLRPAPH